MINARAPDGAKKIYKILNIWIYQRYMPYRSRCQIIVITWFQCVKKLLWVPMVSQIHNLWPRWPSPNVLACLKLNLAICVIFGTFWMVIRAMPETKHFFYWRCSLIMKPTSQTTVLLTQTNSRVTLHAAHPLNKSLSPILKHSQTKHRRRGCERTAVALLWLWLCPYS